MKQTINADVNNNNDNKKTHVKDQCVKSCQKPLVCEVIKFE